MLSTRRRASMVFHVSRLGPRRLLTADVAAPPPSLRSRCWEGGGFGSWADGRWCFCPPALGTLARGRALDLLCCRRLEQCLQLLAHSSLLGGRCLWAAAQEHGRNGRFCDTRRKRGGASASVFASMFAPLLVCGCCRVSPRMVAALVRGRAAGRQPDDAHVGRHSPHGAPPTQGLKDI
jgi:hypothetical protein